LFAHQERLELEEGHFTWIPITSPAEVLVIQHGTSTKSKKNNDDPKGWALQNMPETTPAKLVVYLPL